MVPEPRKPSHLSPLAERCLEALAARGLGYRISVGGAVGLLHFLDYRSTVDLDAWWQPSATGAERLEVEGAVQGILSAHGGVRTRRWGDVVSIELLDGIKKVFSFQVAERSSQLEPSIETPWIAVLMDAWNDLIASKMVALVERGAPRDFRDIHAVCSARLATSHRCWELWRAKQSLSEQDSSAHRARLSIESHLGRLARLRPLAGIADGAEREKAESLRDFFAKEFLDALVD
jgi:hypothetical protein